MIKINLYLSFFLSLSFAVNSQKIDGKDLLEKAISYHDPFSRWESFNSDFYVTMESPQRSPRKSKIELKIFSNQPGVQFYTGQHLRYVNQNKRINKFQGMCFETQGFPNAPNNIKFPSTRLNPSQTYKHNIRFVIGTIK